MLATTNGRTWLMSTPFGKRGFFWEASQSEAWERVIVPATECPRISAGFLASERTELGDLWFRQEYLCEFLDVSNNLFGYDQVLQSTDAELEPLEL